MDMKVTVSTNDIDSLYSCVKNGDQTIRDSFQRIEEIYNKIANYWESDAWDTAYQSYTQKRTQISDVLTQMGAYPSMLEQVSETYKAAESYNKTAASSLPGNIIR